MVHWISSSGKSILETNELIWRAKLECVPGLTYAIGVYAEEAIEVFSCRQAPPCCTPVDVL